MDILEYKERVETIRKEMEKQDVDVFLIYGDEFRRENLRYLANVWPIFERVILLISHDKDPILLVSPENEHLARYYSVWQDIRLIKDLGMAYVPEEVDFTNVEFTSLQAVVKEIIGEKSSHVLISGLDAMCKNLYDRIVWLLGEKAQIFNGDSILYSMRKIKSQSEIQLLKKAWEICDIGYKATLESDIIGLTEIQAAAIAEKAARDAGAEAIIFSLFTSGEERTNIVVGRADDYKINRGDMVMFAFAVQYKGYIASNEWPFVAGGNPTEKQFDLMYHLIKAEDIGVNSIKGGVKQGEVVKAIRKYFFDNGLSAYDLYPPMHGNGLAEAESPYPDDNTTEPFLPGMGVNFDVSLFGIPGVGSNRIEEGFIVSQTGLIPLSNYISSLRKDFLENP